MKQFVKALDKQGHWFVDICTKFPNSCEKLKSGVFNGPNNSALLKDTDFDKLMNKAKADACLNRFQYYCIVS